MIGGTQIVVVQTAAFSFSSIGGGATAQPRRIPGKRLFDTLVTKIVRIRNQSRQGRPLRRQEPVHRRLR